MFLCKVWRSTEIKKSDKRRLMKGSIHRERYQKHWQERRDSHLTPP